MSRCPANSDQWVRIQKHMRYVHPFVAATYGWYPDPDLYRFTIIYGPATKQVIPIVFYLLAYLESGVIVGDAGLES